MTHGRTLWLSIAALLAGACNGAIGDPGAGGDRCTGSSCPPPDSGPPRCEGAVCVPDDCEGTCVGASGLARLTRLEYRNTVQDLFGVAVDPDRLPRDHEIYEAFHTNEPEPINSDDVDRYSVVAESAASTIDVGALTRCTASEDEPSCGRRFVESYAERVHRRPVASDEIDEYVALLGWSLDEGDGFDEAIRLVVATFLQSPDFLYRVESVAEGLTEPLDGFELATRLSFFLWQTTPDEELVAAARAGELDTPERVAAQARRLLSDPRADATIRAFHSGWLGIGAVEMTARADETFDEELGRAMRRETEEVALDVIRSGDGRLGTLLAPGYTILDARMADFYGASEGRITVPERPGILTHASVMTAHAADGYTDPIYRGKMVRQRVLCQSITPPPDISDILAEREAALPDDLSERDRLSALTGDAACQNCHVLTNDIGFGFGSYDALGRFRERDSNDHAIETAFTVESGPAHATDVDGDYASAGELTDALATSDDVALCMAAQWTRFALGRRTDEDGTSITSAFQAFDDAGRDLRELIVAVTTTDAFRHRTAPPGS